MPQFIRHTTLPLRTRNPGPHSMHGMGAINLNLHLTPAQVQNLAAHGACTTANGFWHPTTPDPLGPGQCLAAPAPTGLGAVPTWAWLAGGAVAAGAAWYFFGR